MKRPLVLGQLRKLAGDRLRSGGLVPAEVATLGLEAAAVAVIAIGVHRRCLAEIGFALAAGPFLDEISHRHVAKVGLDNGLTMKATVVNRGQAAALAAGDRVWLSFPPEACTVLQQ